MLRRHVLPGAILLLAGCARAPAPRDVVLLTLDTTRADRLGAYGRPDARTPFLDRLGRQGAVIEEALCDVPVTLPSHTTLMTGIPALGHGVRYNAEFRVSDRARTIAEVLAASGFDTAAFVSALVLDSRFGLDQGFRRFDDELSPGYVKFDSTLYPPETHWLPKADRRADRTVDAALAWLDAARRPFLLWVHVYDPHFPFDPPPPWARTAAEGYLAEIQWTDRQLGRLLRGLEGRGLLDGAAVLATADHGEGLDQHREDGHGIFLYDDTMRVPLLLRAAGAVPAGTVLRGPARTVDVAPTLLELAGRRAALGLGASLVGALAGRASLPDTLAYLESIKTRLFYGGSGLKALRSRDAKFVWAPRPELYDLAVDPGETRNLAERRPDLVARWSRVLEDFVREIQEADLAAVEAYRPDAELREGLASLGYLGGDGGGEEEMRLEGHDPKDLVDVSMAAREIANGFHDRGEAKLRRFFATARPPDREPRMARLWAAAHQNYAKIWLVRGDYAEAAEEYARAGAADPSYEPARWSRVYALNLARDHARAEREARDLITRHPRSYRVMVHRALALAFLGETEAARGVLEQVVREAPAGEDPARSARWYLARLGGPGEEEALATYLDSERRRSAASSRELD
jgi:arylsulfatase A-like enzyme